MVRDSGGHSFFKRTGVRISLSLLLVIVVLSIVGPMLSPHAYDFIYWDYMSMPPDVAKQHYFGTDMIGRDLFVRTLMAGRISLLVALTATLVSLLIGVSYGLVAGFAGGRTDQVMMRFLDVLFALPFMFIVIVLMVLFKGKIWVLFAAIGALIWLDIARIVRGQTLLLRQMAYVEAAQAIGQKQARIAVRHVLPNLLGVIIVYATLTIPQVILIESFLSFLGLGIQEPLTSWGALISEGAADAEIAPWSLLFPSAFLIITLLCLNHLGDALRDYLDPKMRKT